MLQSYEKYLNPATFFAIILLQNATFFDKIFDWLPPIFTKPSNTFSVAFQKVSEGFAARYSSACVKDCDGSDGKI